MKTGLMFFSSEEVANAWLDGKYYLRGPFGKRSDKIPSNAKFYFTELGWDKIGRNVVAACIRTKQDYRVIAIKETDAQIVWEDKYTRFEVAIQPKRKKG
jgi:hypothetical protein